jgi:lipopolysaccharide export system protein LptA
LVRNTVLVLGALGVAAMAWVSLEQILRASPFAKFRTTGKPVGAEVGVTMTGFQMKAYERGRLAAEAKVDTVEVRRDRSQMLMSGVTAGRFLPKEGDPLAFDMQTATYHYFQGRLQAEKGAHVKGKDMDLTSESFVYDEAAKTLLVRGKVQGKLAGGAVKADDLTLFTSSRELSASNVRWIGQIDELTQEGQRREWDITGKNFRMGPDGKTTYYTQARATDGEVIVLADEVAHTKETDVVVAKGNVRYFGVDANLLADEATVYRKERRAVFTGVVRMVVKSEDDVRAAEGEFPTIERVKPETLKTNPQGATQAQVETLRDTENVRKYPIKVIADKVEYWYRKGERRAVITGSPFARQDLAEGWRLGWAPEAFYDGEKHTLTMKGPAAKREVMMFLSIGDQFLFDEVTMSTKEGDNTMLGTNPKATLFIEDDELPPRTTGGGSSGGSTGGTTGGR